MPQSDARILIADDHPHGVELLEAYLSDAPYQVRTATNGEEALQAIRDWRPDVVLLDVMMPRLSGFEVCKRVRQESTLQNIGIIMITALDQTSDVDRAVDAGTDDFLTKPINQADLLLRIRALLGSRLQSDPLKRTLDYFRAVQEIVA